MKTLRSFVFELPRGQTNRQRPVIALVLTQQNVENVACIESDIVLQQPGFKASGLRHLRASHEGASLLRQEVWHRWSVEAVSRAGVARTATALHRSQHRIMETSFAVCRGLEWRTHWTHVSLNVCTVKSLLFTDVVLKYFLEKGLKLDFFFANYQHGSDVLIDTCGAL